MLLWHWVISEKIQRQILSSEEGGGGGGGGNLEEGLCPVFSSVNFNCGNIYNEINRKTMKDKVVICNHESFVCNLIPCVFFVIMNRTPS